MRRHALLVCFIVCACDAGDPEVGGVADTAPRFDQTTPQAFCVDKPLGFECGAEHVCFEGACRRGCAFQGAFSDHEALHAEGCRVCDAFVNRQTLLALADGTHCPNLGVCIGGQCEAYACLIDDVFYPAYARRHAGSCDWCGPEAARDDWSHAAEGELCGDGPTDPKVCLGGACILGCSIGGAAYPHGTPNPETPCRKCDVDVNFTVWVSDDFRVCGDAHDGICVSGECLPGCVDSAHWYPHGPVTECQRCVPGVAYRLSDEPDGTPCGDDSICFAGQCAEGCVVDGREIAAQTRPPDVACRQCEPDVSRVALTPLPDGAVCDDGTQVCVAGECAAGCWIDGRHLAPGESPPDDPCSVCDPNIHLHMLSDRPDGTDVCGAGETCFAGACERGCLIAAGVFYPEGFINQDANCQACRPELTTHAWSLRDEGASCSTGGQCVAGLCVFP